MADIIEFINSAEDTKVLYMQQEIRYKYINFHPTKTEPNLFGIDSRIVFPPKFLMIHAKKKVKHNIHVNGNLSVYDVFCRHKY